MAKERKGIDASFFMEKPVVLFVNDKDRIQRRDGILRGFDHTHYYIEMTFGSQKGQITSFLRTDVKRVQLADATRSNGGDLCG